MLPSSERTPLLRPSASSTSPDLEGHPTLTSSDVQQHRPGGQPSHPDGDGNANGPRPVTRTPLPVKQLIVLCVMRLTEPISYTLIFPFINQMLEDLKVSEDPKQVGYYAGLIESLFAIAQLCTAIFWGRLSDRIGRKPVMLTGLLGMAISVISFGLQKTYLGLIVSRFIAGMMNGNIAILQSVVGEITDSTNFADAAGYLPICYAVGSILGPIIGGCLAMPAQQYPSLFGGWPFLVEYPYFLPCFFGGLLNFAAIGLGICFMEETLEGKRKRPDRPSGDGRADYGTLPSTPEALDHRVPAGPLSNPQKPVSPPPSIRSLCTQPVLMVFLAFMIMHFQNISWNAIIPLYAYTKIENGGLNLSLDQIGLMLSTSGFGSILVQLWVFPRLQRKYGVVKLFQTTLIFFWITFMSLPLVTYLARLPGNTKIHTLSYMAVVMLLRSPGVMCYVSVLMMTNMLSPSSTALGTLNGMSQTCRALAQALGPIAGTSLFALSISTGVLGGNLVWVVMTLTGLMAQVCSLMIRREAVESKKNR